MKYVVDIPGELPNHGALQDARPLGICDEIEDALGAFCNDYCKYSDKHESESELWDKACANCPM